MEEFNKSVPGKVGLHLLGVCSRDPGRGRAVTPAQDPHVSLQDHSSRTGFSLEHYEAHSRGNGRAGEQTQHLAGFFSPPRETRGLL